jgi:hypothetical protein
MVYNLSFKDNSINSILLGSFWNQGNDVNIDLTNNDFTNYRIEQLTIYLLDFTTDLIAEKTINLYQKDVVVTEPAIGNSNKLYNQYNVRILFLAVQSNIILFVSPQINPIILVNNYPKYVRFTINLFPKYVHIYVNIGKYMATDKIIIKEVHFTNEQGFYDIDLFFEDIVMTEEDNTEVPKNLNVPLLSVVANEQNFAFGTNPKKIFIQYRATGTIKGTNITSSKEVNQRARAIYPLDVADDAIPVAVFSVIIPSWRSSNYFACIIRLENIASPDHNKEYVIGYNEKGFIDLAAIQAITSDKGYGVSEARVVEIFNPFGNNFLQLSANAQHSLSLADGAIVGDGLDDIITAQGISIEYIGSWYVVSKKNGFWATYIEFFNAVDKYIYGFGRGDKGMRMENGAEDFYVEPFSEFETASYALYRYSFDGSTMKIERNGVLIDSAPATITDLNAFISSISIFGGNQLGANYSGSSILYFVRFNGLETAANVIERTSRIMSTFNL